MIQIQDELHAWLALAAGSAAARLRARRLLQHFGGPLEIFQVSRADLQAALQGLTAGGPGNLNGLFGAVAPTAAASERTRRWLAADHRHHVITLADARYPRALLNSPDPPLVLHAMGDVAALEPTAVAIVGSRHATPAGCGVAARLAAELTNWGVTVVSGLAVGIDAAAHRGCLDSPGSPDQGRTIAVVASGLHEVYPREHAPLFEEIKSRGLILSEHPLDTPALPAFFPQRNRIIAGLSVVTVVVEATIRSGSLITARLALEAGREVFAVPGHLGSPQSAGCNALIKGGAGLLEGAEDLAMALPWAFPAHSVVTPMKPLGQRAQVKRNPPTQAPSDASAETERPPSGDGAMARPAWLRTRALLRSRPCDLAELTAAADVPAEVVSQTLLLAELDGLVARLPGGVFQWCGPSV